MDLGTGILGMIALVAITREMFRPGRGWGKMKSGQASLRIARVAVGCSGWPYHAAAPCLALPCFDLSCLSVIIVSFRLFRGSY